MKNLISFTISILILSFSLKSQTPTFDFLLSGNENDFVEAIYETSSDDIFFVGYTSKYPDMWIKSRGLVGKLTKNGTLIDTAVFDYPGMRFSFKNILPAESNHFVIVGYLTDTSGQRQNISIVLTKIDSDLNVIGQKRYYMPNDYKYFFMNAHMGLYNSILIVGSVLPGTNGEDSFIYRFNQNLDSIKAKFFSTNGDLFYQLQELDNQSLWVLPAVLNKFIIIDSTWSDISYFDKPYFLNANYGFKWDSDTSFYLAADYVDIPASKMSDHDIGILRQFHPVDTTNYLFNSVGRKDTLDLPAANRALDYNNKDSIFIGGTINYLLYTYPQEPSWYIVIQIDSMLNVRWERFYGGDAYYVMYEILATNDGGCLIAGTRYDYQNATEEELDIHILKLNSQGLLVGEQNHNTIQVREALVFPNPGTNYLKVRVAAQYTESIFELYDIKGKQVLTKEILGKWGDINTSFLKSGTYVYRIHNNKGLFETGKWVKQ